MYKDLPILLNRSKHWLEQYFIFQGLYLKFITKLEIRLLYSLHIHTRYILQIVQVNKQLTETSYTYTRKKALRFRFHVSPLS